MGKETCIGLAAALFFSFNVGTAHARPFASGTLTLAGASNSLITTSVVATGTISAISFHKPGDANGDGFFDGRDLRAILTNFGTQTR
jgi:hypothetical protein